MDDEIRLLRIENARLVRECAQKDREFLQMKELLVTTGNHLFALTEPLRQTARSVEQIAAREFTTLLKMAADIEALKTAQAVTVDNVKEVRHDLTGKFPIQPLEVDDTDKAIGKFVRGVFRRGWVKLAVASGGGLTVGGVFHWLWTILTKGK